MCKKILTILAVITCISGCDSDIIATEACQNCTDDEICCGNACVKKDSPAHCGTCDNVCNAGEVCIENQCSQEPGKCIDGNCECIPKTCEELGKNCGTADDGCGGKIECGTCEDGVLCTNNICGCEPKSCQELGKDCGTADDGCGGKIECGTCADGKACVDNICGCKPKTCEELGKNCGTVLDGCGGKLECGSCADGLTCKANICGCVAKTCDQMAFNCGTADDGCGGKLDCGECTGGQKCTNNVCSCAPKSCKELGRNCGTTDDGCGGKLDCGECSGGQTCTNNICGCKPKTCAELGKNCGTTDNGCGSSLQCGSCAEGQTCTNNVCSQKSVKDIYPKRMSIKGLQPDFQDPEEIIGNGVHGVAMNLVWETWEGTPHANCGDNEVLYDGHCFKIESHTANAIKTYSDNGIVITAVVYGVPAWCRRSCTNVSAPYFCAPTSEGAKHYGRFVGFLANYFNGENGHGRIADFVIHNEVNSTSWFNYGCTTGNCNLDTWTSVYAESWNAAYDAAIKEQKNAKVLISLQHFWTFNDMGASAPSAAGESFLKSLIPKLGNRDWRIAYHSYPSNLLSPNFGPNDLGNTGRITFGNIGILAGWLRKNYPNDPHAWEIQLTENGINGVGKTMQEQQKTQLCQAFRNILGTPGIESFIYHRLVDHPTELQDGLGCGLWGGSSNGHPNPDKPAWSTYAYSNRSGVADGFPNCGFEYLPYVQMSRGSNNAGMHWITTRQMPSGFKFERSWRILREPDNDTVMVYECRVGGVSGNHTMISRSVDCEGQFSMGPMGYVYTKQVAGTKPIYRCYVQANGSHFVSPAADCEGQIVEQPAPYGYAFD